MNDNRALSSQFEELAVKLASRVAEMIQESSMTLESVERKRIESMLENELPTIVFNSLMKSGSMKTQEGLKYLDDNFEKFALMYYKKILGKG